MNKSHYYTIFVLVFLVAVLSGLVYFQIKFKKELIAKPKSIDKTEKTISPSPKISLTPEIPPPISITIVSQIGGGIEEIKDNSLKFSAEHPLFSPEKTKKLEAIIDENTTISSKGKIIAQGKDGLKLFKIGFWISVTTDENVLEKNKFKAKDVDIPFLSE